MRMMVVLLLFDVFSPSGFADQAVLEEIARARESSNPSEIVKIAAKFADEIVAAPEVSRRLISAAIGLYRKAEALNPQALTADDASRVGRMYLLLSESYADVARRYLERAVKEEDREEDHVALGNALLYLGEAALARKEYLEVSERRPQDPVLWVNLAMAERALGDTPSAYGRLRQVMTRTSNPAVAKVAGLALADIQIASNDVSGAKLEVLKILNRRPADIDALRLLKKIYEREGRKDLADQTERRISQRAGTTGAPALIGKGNRK